MDFCQRKKTLHWQKKILKYGSSLPQMFWETGALEYFANFTKKHLYWYLIFKKETPAQAFSFEFYEIFKNTFLVEHVWVTDTDTENNFILFYEL